MVAYPRSVLCSAIHNQPDTPLIFNSNTRFSYSSARHIKWRFPEDIRQRLLALEWWQYRVADFRGLTIEHPEVFIHQIERLKRAGDIKPYQPRVLTTQDL